MSSIILLELHARERLAAGDTWHAHTFHAECNPADRSQLMYYRVVGCMAPLLTRGRRTGKPNFRKCAKETEATVYILPADQAAWEAAWEQRTGQCRGCLGVGETVVSWSRDTGKTKQPCRACGGTGQPGSTQEEG